MDSCIFTSHCVENVCDRSCPILAETSYLLERNNIKMTSKVFNSTKHMRNCTNNLIDNIRDGVSVVISDNTIDDSNLIAYTAICKNWKGNKLGCNVYHLRFSSHLDAVQKSWSSKYSESLEYETIWAKTAKILIISSLDYVQFKDFQAQSLLNIIHERNNSGLSTIIVSPPLQSLSGQDSSVFYIRLKEFMRKAVIAW